MTELKEKVQNALDECRMLILGGQVLISFAAEAVLQPGFRELSSAGRAACVAGMLCLVAAVGTLMWPAAYHRIACRGNDRRSLVRFATRAACAALIPFAAGLLAAIYIAGERAAGAAVGVLLTTGAGAAAITAWYVVPLVARSPHKEQPMQPEEPSTPLADKIRHVLTEARMVLPGAQALLGFGSLAVLMDSFKTLPDMLKTVHLVGLAFIALAVVLLMTPAAFHRIAERGEQTERLHRWSTRLLLAAMASLALGLAAAVWLVVEVGAESRPGGVAAAATVVACFYTAWFVLPLVARPTSAFSS
jgi:hypothetical protein